MTAYIKSIQQVSITIGTSQTSNTATINSVDTTKAHLILQGFTSGNTATNDSIFLPRVELTNATTVTASRHLSSASSTNNVVVQAVVVEYTSDMVSSIQAGTITFSSVNTGTATITSVDTTRAAVFFLGQETSAGTNDPRNQAAVTLTDATTVTADSQNSITTLVVGFVVVEYKAAVIKSVQQFSNQFSTTNSTDTQTISSVTTGNTMIAYGGEILNITNFTGMYAIRLTSSTNINLERTATTSATRTPRYTVIEFNSGILNSGVQRGTISLASSTSNTATISSVNTSIAFANFIGYNYNNTATTINILFPAVSLTNSTTVTATKNTGTNTTIVSYEVVEFTNSPSSDVSISGAASLSITDTATKQSSSSISGAATMSVADIATKRSSSTISGAATVSAPTTATKQSSSSISGSAILSVADIADKQSSSAISGAASLVVVGGGTAPDESIVTISGKASLSLVSNSLVSSSFAISGAALLSIADRLEKRSVVTILGQALVTPVGTAIPQPEGPGTGHSLRIGFTLWGT